ncbi:DgyrCDS5748 [Dimorphilus gyrociliatus]|uniref:DgyrCDS5748 n=1 Tax=Dimorphilus gyrociliatus TaxID=2664684 RepID=A0A7I8VMD6_9ANNE|nr:DgyrCDS5748 [Dimorphilus gyrociliatus]
MPEDNFKHHKGLLLLCKAAEVIRLKEKNEWNKTKSKNFGSNSSVSSSSDDESMEDVDFSVKVSIVEHSLENEQLEEGKTLPSKPNDHEEKVELEATEGTTEIALTSDSAMEMGHDEIERSEEVKEELSLELVNEGEEVTQSESLEKEFKNHSDTDDLNKKLSENSSQSDVIVKNLPENSAANTQAFCGKVDIESQQNENERQEEVNMIENRNNEEGVEEEKREPEKENDNKDEKPNTNENFDKSTHQTEDNMEGNKKQETDDNNDHLTEMEDDTMLLETNRKIEEHTVSNEIENNLKCNSQEILESSKSDESYNTNNENIIIHELGVNITQEEQTEQRKLDFESIEILPSRIEEEMETETTNELQNVSAQNDQDESKCRLESSIENEEFSNTMNSNNNEVTSKNIKMSCCLEKVKDPLPEDPREICIMESEKKEDIGIISDMEEKMEEINESRICETAAEEQAGHIENDAGDVLSEEQELDVEKVSEVEEMKKCEGKISTDSKMNSELQSETEVVNEMEAADKVELSKESEMKNVEEISVETLREPEINIETIPQMEIVTEQNVELPKEQERNNKEVLIAKFDQGKNEAAPSNNQLGKREAGSEVKHSFKKEQRSNELPQQKKKANEKLVNLTVKEPPLLELGKRVKIEMEETDKIVEIEMKDVERSREPLKKRKQSEPKENVKRVGERRARRRDTTKSKAESQRTRKQDSKTKEKKKPQEKAQVVLATCEKEKEVIVERQKPEKRKSRAEGKKKTSRGKSENAKSKLKKETSQSHTTSEEYDIEFIIDEMEKVKQKVSSGRASWEEVLSYRMFDRRPWKMDEIYCHLRYDLDIHSENTVFLEKVRISLQQALKKWKYSNQVVDNVLIYYEECLSAQLLSVDEIIYLLKRRKPVVYDRRRFLFQREMFIVRSCLENITSTDKNVIEQNRDICYYFLYVQASRFLSTLVRRTQTVVEAFLKFSSMVKTPSCVR